MYVKGKNDIFWHWEEECENYPSRIVKTSIDEKENLCPECYKIQKEKNKNVKIPVGSIARRGLR